MSSPVRTATSGADRLRNLAAIMLFLAAIAVLVGAFVFARNPGSSGAARSGSAGGDATGYHVARAGCDDNRRPEVALNASTPWCSPARAATAAPDGSAILVAAGRYPQLQLDKSAHAVTFQPADPSRRPVIAGVRLTGVTGISVRGFLLTQQAFVSASRDVAITDNGFAGHGIYVRQSRRVSITGNRVRNVKGEERALLAQGAPETANKPNEDLTIRGNLFDDIDHDAIAVYNSHRNVVIEGNRISNVHQPDNFRFHSDAMQLMGGDAVSLRNNVITDVSHGILIKDGPPSTRLQVVGNVVTGTKGAGLEIYDARGARLANNTIWGTSFGVIVGDASAHPGRTKVTLVRNVLDQLLRRNPTVVSRAQSNVFGRGTRVGRPAYGGRPNFVNAKRRDLRIRRSRPGAGIPRGRPLPGAQRRVR